jgi:hypothetical protein
MRLLLSALCLCSGSAALTRAATPSQVWTQLVRNDPAHPDHFVREDGSHLFLFNKTAWHYFSAVHPAITLDRAARLEAGALNL